MTSRDFCYWLQGFFELSQPGNSVTQPGAIVISAEQSYRIKNHLALVFKHEIDPSMGGPKQQQALNQIHNTGLHDPPLMRC